MYLEIISTIILVFFTWLFWENWSSSDTPPGPLKIPLLGTLVQIGLADSEGYLAMHKLSLKYGNIMGLKMGFVNAIVLSSYETIRDVYTREETLGRYCDGIFWERNLRQDLGIVFSNGKTWEIIRRFSRDRLKDYGFGNRNAMEQLIHEEIEDLLKFMKTDLDSSNGKIHFSAYYFQFAFVNSLASMITGSRCAYEDIDIQNLLKASRDYIESGVVGAGLLTGYPFLRFIFPETLGFGIQMRTVKHIHGYAEKLLETRKKQNYKKNPTCFTDDFLNKMDSEATNPSTLFTRNQFLVLFTDLLQTGSDTSSNALNFIILLLTCHPNVQDKMYEEILKTCGTDKLPSMNDRAKMPYTKAVILEGLRWGRTVVNGVPKKVTKDFIYKNYRFKKNTIIMMNTHTVFFDEEFWGDPHVFRPERFIDDSGEIISVKADRIGITFSAGKRNCFGEVLARDSIFLVLASLIQRFSFKVPPNQEQPRLDPLVAFSVGPHPYDAMVESR